jgi:hypothetical protein
MQQSWLWTLFSERHPEGIDDQLPLQRSLH